MRGVVSVSKMTTPTTTKYEAADYQLNFLKEEKTAGHVTKALLWDGGK
jgi:hypothetical protein